MNEETALALSRITSSFYAQVSDSFSQTRSSAWQGWERCAALVEERLLAAPDQAAAKDEGGAADALAGAERTRERTRISVLDVACGNLRFERFLENHFPQTSFSFHAVDNCLSLMQSDYANRSNDSDTNRLFSEAKRLAHRGKGGSPSAQSKCGSAKSSVQEGAALRYFDYCSRQAYEYDIVQGLICNDVPFPSDVPCCHLAVSFGFMHHLPGKESRLRLLKALSERLLPGGLAMVSFWRFANDARLLAKAQANTHQALQTLDIDSTQLDENDYFLGWQQTEGVFRYCHHFTEEEVDELAEKARLFNLKPIACFDADGKTGNLNRYLVLQSVSQNFLEKSLTGVEL